MMTSWEDALSLLRLMSLYPRVSMDHQLTDLPKLLGQPFETLNLRSQTSSETLDVIHVQVGRRFVQRQDSAVQGQALRQSDPDQDTRQDLLTGTASSSHVKLGLVCQRMDRQRRSTG